VLGIASAAAPVRASFGYCHIGGGTNCVVDGDTFWINGEKVRIAGIDAPETHPPRCAYEARLGEQATEKLHALLNSGAVTMTSIDRDRDRYGRLLRNVAVNGEDVGEAMISAGVAREYGSGRRPWC
jgi:endonuclease YncB( thermonuclease family)